MDFVKRKGHPVEIAKKLMWKEETLLAAHEKYLEVWGKYQKAKNQKDRVDDAMRLWQSCRADIRKI